MQRLPWRRIGVAIALGVATPACVSGDIFDSASEGNAGDSSDGGEASSSMGSTTAASASDEESGSAADTGSSGDPTSAGSDSGDPTGVQLSGEELFTALCSTCHGTSAEGGDKGYELQHHTREHLLWVVRNGRPGLEFDNSVMSPFPEAVLSDEQIDLIGDFLDSFPQPDTGEGLYHDYCSNCHGQVPDTGLIDTEILGRPYNEIREKVREGESLGNVGARGSYMPRFGTDRISDGEVQLIADFLGG